MSGEGNNGVYNPSNLNLFSYTYNNPVNYTDPDGAIVWFIPLVSFVAKELASEAVEHVTGVPMPTLKNGSKFVVKQMMKEAKKGGLKRIPKPDGGYSADLSKSKAKSRSGHRNAGNKQLHEDMKKDPKLRKDIETKFGDDAFDRTSTSKSGRKNPKGAEWDHNSNDPNKLDLRSKDNHRQKTSIEGRKGGGFKKFHKDK